MPVPQPGPGQVLVKMRMSSVNPSDQHFIKGEYGQPRIKGAPAGFEGCGDVVAAGDGAEKARRPAGRLCGDRTDLGRLGGIRGDECVGLHSAAP
ncbi:alcohol dehydrogenase catalytic domain-containing protein [Jhaorihella thermophila]